MPEDASTPTIVHGTDRQLIADNAKYRARIKALRTALEDAEQKLKAATPAEGAVVLSGDDAKRWTAFQALGKTPEELTAALQAGEAATGQLATYEWEGVARKAAQLAGLNADALLVAPGVRDLSFVVKKVTEDGKEVERAYVREGKDAAEKPLGKEYVEGRDQWKPLAPALLATEAAQSQPTRGIQMTPERHERQRAQAPTTDEFRQATERTADYNVL
jgi:hypothetical protein